MIQRFDEPTSRAMLALPSAGLATVVPRAGSMLALPSGDIAGDLRECGHVKAKGKSGRRALYELLIANNTASPVATFAYALADDGPLARVTWDAIIVPAYSSVAVDLELSLPPGRRKPQMVAEIHANGLSLTLDAKAPPAGVSGRGGASMRRPIAAVAALALLVGAALGVSGMKPRLIALAAPDTVMSGQPFDVAYIARSADDAAYTVDTPDGREVAAGPLDPRAGSFSVALPGGPLSQGYDVHVTARGRLGADERTVHVVALPPPPAPAVNVAVKPQNPLRITRVRLASDAVDGGQPIVVSYRSTVNSGSVRLLDQYGTVRAEALLSPRGTSTLAAPFVDTDQDLTVLITAQRGSQRVRAAIPVTVRRIDQAAIAQQRLAAAAAAAVPAVAPVAAPAAAVAPPAVPAAAPDTVPAPAQKGPTVSDGTAADGAPAVAAGPPIEVAASQVAGHAVAIHVLRHYPGLHVAMMGPGGEEVVSSAVSPAASTVLFAPPDLPAGTHGGGYSIVATFSRGVGQETLIRPIAFRR